MSIIMSLTTRRTRRVTNDVGGWGHSADGSIGAQPLRAVADDFHPHPAGRGTQHFPVLPARFPAAVLLRRSSRRCARPSSSRSSRPRCAPTRVAVTALVLMFVVPAYGAVRRRIDGARLLQAVTVFFAVNMLGFAGRRVLRHLHLVHVLRLGEHLRRDDRRPVLGVRRRHVQPEERAAAVPGDHAGREPGRARRRQVRAARRRLRCSRSA